MLGLWSVTLATWLLWPYCRVYSLNFG